LKAAEERAGRRSIEKAATLSIAELQVELRKKGLPTYGEAEEMAARLSGASAGRAARLRERTAGGDNATSTATPQATAIPQASTKRARTTAGAAKAKEVTKEVVPEVTIVNDEAEIAPGQEASPSESDQPGGQPAIKEERALEAAKNKPEQAEETAADVTQDEVLEPPQCDLFTSQEDCKACNGAHKAHTCGKVRNRTPKKDKEKLPQKRSQKPVRKKKGARGSQARRVVVTEVNTDDAVTTMDEAVDAVAQVEPEPIPLAAFHDTPPFNLPSDWVIQRSRSRGFIGVRYLPPLKKRRVQEIESMAAADPPTGQPAGTSDGQHEPTAAVPGQEAGVDSATGAEAALSDPPMGDLESTGMLGEGWDAAPTENPEKGLEVPQATLITNPPEDLPGNPPEDPGLPGDPEIAEASVEGHEMAIEID